MPIEVKFVEAGIGMGVWSGDITADEIMNATRDANRIMKEHGFDTFVFVIDGREMTSVPFKISTLKWAASKTQTIAYLIVSSSLSANLAVKLAEPFTPQSFEFHQSIDSALAQARRLVKDRQLIS